MPPTQTGRRPLRGAFQGAPPLDPVKSFKKVKLLMENSILIKERGFINDLDESLKREIFSKGEKKRYAQGDMIFLEGEPGECFYHLISGSVKMVKTSSEGKETVIKIIKPGEIFAEVILFENDRYPVTALAVSETEALCIHKRVFIGMLDNPDVRERFIKVLISKQRYLSERIHYLSTLDVEERFFKYLIQNFGRRESYEISIPKKEIASTIGTIPETFSRLLLRLRKRNIIEWRGKTLKVEKNFLNSFVE